MPIKTTAIVDSSGVAPWSNAVINTNTTTGFLSDITYGLRSGAVLHEDFNAVGALNDSCLYVPNIGDTLTYYGVGSNPYEPLYSYTQYNFAPNGALNTVVEVFAGKEYFNTTPFINTGYLG